MWQNVDAHCEWAERHGALIVQRAKTFPNGERQYSAQDFVGQRWTFTETVADVDPADWGGLLAAQDSSG